MPSIKANGRDDLEIYERAYPDPSNLREIPGRGDAVHDDAKHDHGNQHLDELDEAVAQRLHLKRQIRIGHAKSNTQSERNDDLEKSDLNIFGTTFPAWLAFPFNAAWSASRPMPLLFLTAPLTLRNRLLAPTRCCPAALTRLPASIPATRHFGPGPANRSSTFHHSLTMQDQVSNI
jgi:hypothetical protein